MAETLKETIARRLDERPADVDRLRAGDDSALEDLLEMCTGARVKSVTVRTLPNRSRT
jgi:hypothetical protein